MPATINLISPEILERVQAYNDYLNYWDCIEWPRWMKDMYYAVKHSKPEVLNGYLPYIRNAYQLLKPE